jgi:hypothetical protein
MILPAGTIKMELGEADVAAAVEFWLREKVLKVPCTVPMMEVVGLKDWETASFTVTLGEEGEMGEAVDGGEGAEYADC